MRYTSDLTDSQWAVVEPLLPKPGNKSKYAKRDLLDAVLYVSKTGCQWRNLPKDFPDWQAVYQFFKRAKASGLWENLQSEMVKMTRRKAGRNPDPSYALIDSQSTKTTANADSVGYDGGKK